MNQLKDFIALIICGIVCSALIGFAGCVLYTDLAWRHSMYLICGVIISIWSFTGLRIK